MDRISFFRNEKKRENDTILSEKDREIEKLKEEVSRIYQILSFKNEECAEWKEKFMATNQELSEVKLEKSYMRVEINDLKRKIIDISDASRLKTDIKE